MHTALAHQAHTAQLQDRIRHAALRRLMKSAR
jgi:hypothetical protein